jgi:hypothetical protein
MPRTLFAVPQLHAVVLMLALLPGQVVAGLPERISGVMVLDQEVLAWLREYHAAKDEKTQLRLLRDLARTRDPRVAMVLGEWVVFGDFGRTDPKPIQIEAARLLCVNYLKRDVSTLPIHLLLLKAHLAWLADGEEIRARAKRLPQ